MKIFWNKISTKVLPKWVIREFFYKLNLTEVVKRNKVPYEILDAKIEVDPDFIPWWDVVKDNKWDTVLSQYYFKYGKCYESYYSRMYWTLNTKFIENHIGELKDYMPFVSKYVALSEEFITKNEDIIDWGMLSESTRVLKFTNTFLVRHINKFDTDKLIYSQFVPMQVVIKHPQKFNLYKYYKVIATADNTPYTKSDLDAFKELFKEQIKQAFLIIMSNL